MTTLSLPEITKTMATSLYSTKTRRECWKAETTDGMWTFERLEDDGTPWIVVHNATGLDVRAYFGTLKACRRSVALGLAERDIQAQAVCLLLTGKRYAR